MNVVLVVLLFAVIIVLSIWLWRCQARVQRLLITLETERSQRAQRIKDSVAKSRSVHMGKISEQIAPMLPDFPYHPRDVQWVGGTVDAIIWHGLESDADEIDIVFLDVKTGSARISHRQRLIRAAIEAGRVKFEVYRLHQASDYEPGWQGTEISPAGTVKYMDAISSYPTEVEIKTLDFPRRTEAS